jgi:hypothetical protein
VQVAADEAPVAGKQDAHELVQVAVGGRVFGAGKAPEGFACVGQ